MILGGEAEPYVFGAGNAVEAGTMPGGRMPGHTSIATAHGGVMSIRNPSGLPARHGSNTGE